ncbi:amino acid racemase [Leucobacter sp. cx-42]|uniref:aspartate/glutamate racemase family protein n=1 Tax=unclassified Leucobacter TaxID=2621730 RepID=UPI00165E144C|nr:MULTISPECIES: amino acid racemase [unclassified Leucobacter]MBC9954015.1 amino acid racemase [Leucobacter sp. cx-42]
MTLAADPEGARRVVGVLGGMGPAATADFYGKIVQITPAERDQDHLRTLIWSDPTIPDRTGALVDRGPHPGRQLADGARILENSGAHVIAVPCNTAHAFLPEIRAAVDVPVLDMIAATRDRALGMLQAGGSVGILATHGTIRARLYEQAFAERGVAVMLPDERLQSNVMDAIRLVKKQPQDAEATRLLEQAVTELSQSGAGVVIAGCTEIPVALAGSAHLEVPLIDSTDVLAHAVVDWAFSGSAHPATMKEQRAWSV